eukprot:jgi/Mesvir1/5464/Mv15518-RA.1
MGLGSQPGLPIHNRRSIWLVCCPHPKPSIDLSPPAGAAYSRCHWLFFDPPAPIVCGPMTLSPSCDPQPAPPIGPGNLPPLRVHYRDANGQLRAHTQEASDRILQGALRLRAGGPGAARAGFHVVVTVDDWDEDEGQQECLKKGGSTCGRRSSGAHQNKSQAIVVVDLQDMVQYMPDGSPAEVILVEAWGGMRGEELVRYARKMALIEKIQQLSCEDRLLKQVTSQWGHENRIYSSPQKLPSSVTITRNVKLAPGTQLFDTFLERAIAAADASGTPEPSLEVAFHGTYEHNVTSIFEKGLTVTKSSSVYYMSTAASYCYGYCRSVRKTIVIFLVLLTHVNAGGRPVLTSNSTEYQLPVAMAEVVV